MTNINRYNNFRFWALFSTAALVVSDLQDGAWLWAVVMGGALAVLIGSAVQDRRERIAARETPPDWERLP